MAPASYEPLDREDDDAEGYLDNPHGNQSRKTGVDSIMDVIHDSRIPRPVVYYGDGPFDPPSSESDDEDAALHEKPPRSPGMAERAGYVPDEGDIDLVLGGGKKRPTSLKYLIFALGGLLSIAIAIGFFAALSYSGSTFQRHGAQHLTMDHIFNGTFTPTRQSIRWVPEAGDGVFSIEEGGYIKLVDLKTNTTSNLVRKSDVQDTRQNSFGWSSWSLSADMKYVLVKTDEKKQWRWSSFGNYYIHNLETGSTHPLTPPTSPPTVAYAAWAPAGQALAFVSENDLYYVPSPNADPVRVTYSGSASFFNGVPDWVYEEEVFSDDYSLWFSPSSNKIAFLYSDEAAVDVYSFPVYNPTDDANSIIPYTSTVDMKYPKPGYPNPLVGIKVFDIETFTGLREATFTSEREAAEEATTELEWGDRLPLDNSIISEVSWVGDGALVLKEVDRSADDGHVVLFEVARGPIGRSVRTLGAKGEEKDGGWIDSAQTIYPLPDSLVGDGEGGYLDILPNAEGYNHIVLFSPPSTSTPRFLTNGSWEVVDTILGVDPTRKLIYFSAANPSSIERSIQSIALPDDMSSSGSSAPLPAITTLTDTSTPSYYDASFSPQAGFYLLNYQGPNVPWQRIVRAGDSSFDYLLTANDALNQTLGRFQEAVISRTTIESDGYELNALEIRPPRMDDSGRTKYPVLFRVYGGPGSQLVDYKFSRDWHHYLACEMGYIIVIVDGRGTGFKGRHLRNPVNRNLGFFEVKDQVNAARLWASKSYVDSRRIGIWGWSYGGFMSAKVVEADAGIHSLAMSVAPVTSWRLYDSIYTERYMGLPDANPGGYINASVSNVTAFNKVDYLLAHGSGDDNVHFANSAHLLDMFTQAGIRGFRFRMFTDSDHSIATRGAYRELHEWMTEFLFEKWGKGGRKRGW